MIVDKCLEAQYRLLENIYEGRPVEIYAYDEDGVLTLMEEPTQKENKKRLICNCEHPEKCNVFQNNLFQISIFKQEDLVRLKTQQKVIIYTWGNSVCSIVSSRYYRIIICHANNINQSHNGFFMICEDITEEKQNAVRLRKAECNMNLALEAGNVVPWRYDFAKEELTIRSFGVKKSFKKEEMNKMIHPDDLDMVHSVFKQFREKKIKKIKKIVRFYFPEEEKYCYFEGRMIADYDEWENVVGILGTQHNIDEETLIKKDLEQYKLHTRLVNEICNIEQWYFDPETSMLHSENRSSSVYGINISLQNYLNAYVHPDDHHFYWDYLKDECYLKHPIHEVHVRMRIEDSGDYRYMVINCITHIDDQTGKPLIIGIRRDETKEKWQQKQIEDNSNRLKYVMRMGKIIPMEWDVSKGLFRLDYPEMRSVMPNTFRSFGQWVDINFVVNSVHPDERKMVMEYWKDMCEGKKNEIKFKLRYDSNQVFENTFDLHLVVEEKDEKTNMPLRIVGYMQDRTDHETLIKNLIEERFKAEEANRLKTAFLANISHEIRTPLNAIVGFSNLLADNETTDEYYESRKEFADIIKENSDLLLELVNRVIELSRIEAGKTQRMLEDFQINDLFHISYNTLRLQKKNSQVEFILDIPEESTMVHLDRRRMSEVLNNFVSNAFKYTEKGSVKMGYRIKEQNLHIFVQDTGCGINPEDKPKIFQRFEKLGSMKQGAGLGMSICLAYVENSNGHIGVDSEVGKGSNFWVDVPLR